MASIIDRSDGTQDDVEGIVAAALDYLDGYLQADADRHLGAYHPEAIKRRYDHDEDGVYGIISLSPQTMADYAATNDPEHDDDVEIFIDAVSQDIASVRIYSSRWVDFLHVVKARGAWRLFHVTWHRRSPTTDEA